MQCRGSANWPARSCPAGAIQMTIDEKLEAITQSLELMNGEHGDFERHTRERIAQHERELEAVRERQARIDDNLIVQGEVLARLELRFDRMVERQARIDEHMESLVTGMAELQVLTKLAHERLDRAGN